MTENKQNVIFILTDDQGWEDLGCFGHCACNGRYVLKTPVLDKMAKEGLRLTSFYTNSPVCSPSRAGLLTGLYPARHGIDYALHADKAADDRLGQAHYLNPEVPTIASLLRDAGYQTAHFGKWHLGQASGAGTPVPGVDAYGFDTWACNGTEGPELWRSDKGEKKALHNSSEVIINRSIEFLESRDPSKPFFMNVWMLDPHSLLDPTPEQMEEYADLAPLPDDLDKHSGTMRVYYSVITNMDRQIGRLLDKLDKLGLAEDTVIVFTSDNGPAPIWDTSTSHSGAGRTGPFRGIKASLYEGGVRMPFIVRWPGRTPADRVNNKSIVSGTDLLPTFCAIAGIEPPAGLDGQNMMAVFQGSFVEREKPLFWEFRFASWGRHIQLSLRYAMRKDRWKLMMNADAGVCELYDLSKDMNETANCAKYEPEIVRSMSAELLAWAKGLPSWGKHDFEHLRTYPWPRSGEPIDVGTEYV